MAAGYCLGTASAATRGELHVTDRNGYNAGPCTTYQFIIARSGERKSRARDAFAAILDRLEEKYRTRVEQENRTKRAELEQEAADAAGVLAGADDDPMSRPGDKPKKAAGRGGPGRPPKPVAGEYAGRPVPKLLANSSSPEALNRRAAEQGGPVVFLSGEATILADGLNRPAGKGGAAFGALCNLYDAGAIDDERVTRDSQSISRATATICVGFQPGALDLKDASIGASGLFSRVTFVVPMPLHGQRVHRDVPTLPRAIRDEWEGVIRGIHARGVTSHHARTADWVNDRSMPLRRPDDDADIDPGLTLSPEAHELLVDLRESIERDQEGGELLDALLDIPGWLDKAPQRVMRDAALIELINNTAPVRYDLPDKKLNQAPIYDSIATTVSGESMAAAIARFRYSMVDAVEAVGIFYGIDRDIDVRALRVIVKAGENGVKARDIYRELRLDAATFTRAAIVDRLIQSGEVIIQARARKGSQATTTTDWYVATSLGVETVAEMYPERPVLRVIEGGR